MRITTGKYAGESGTIESNVYQRTVDYPDEWANGLRVMLDTEEVVTVRWRAGAVSSNVVRNVQPIISAPKVHFVRRIFSFVEKPSEVFYYGLGVRP